MRELKGVNLKERIIELSDHIHEIEKDIIQLEKESEEVGSREEAGELDNVIMKDMEVRKIDREDLIGVKDLVDVGLEWMVVMEKCEDKKE